jgi:hypothetical protein
MAAIDISNLASSIGLPIDMFKSGIGAILNFLKEKLPGNLFGQVQEKVPESNKMMEQAAAAPEAPPGGLAATVTQALGAAGAVGALFSKLSALGLSLDQIKAFLPKALEFLKAHLPANLVSQVTNAVQQGG